MDRMAATAEEMSSQATNLQQLMSFFDIGQGAKVGVGGTAKKAAAPIAMAQARPKKGIGAAPSRLDEASFVNF